MDNYNKNYVVIAILLQSTIVIIFNSTILNSNSLEILKRNIPVYNILVVLTTFLIIISLIKIREYESKKIELKLTQKNLKSIEELLTLLRTERHEYVTNLQSIESLVYLEEYQELGDYIKGLSSIYRANSEIIRIGNPALSVLVSAKREDAKQKGIKFYIDSKRKIEATQLNSWELCSIFSNIIQNAIDACEKSTDKKWIRLIIDSDINNYVIKVENTGQISQEIIDKIFEAGVTTKDSKARGYGLYICNALINKYEGSIEYENTDTGTVLCTLKLPREEYYIDTKVV